MFFLRKQRQRRLQLAIGKMLKTVSVPFHLKQALKSAVVRVEIVMTNRPALSVPIGFSSLEVKVRQAKGDASPGQAAASHLTALGPKKGLVCWRAVGILIFIGVQGRILLPVPRMLGLPLMPAAEQTLRSTQTVRRF